MNYTLGYARTAIRNPFSFFSFYLVSSEQYIWRIVKIEKLMCNMGPTELNENIKILMATEMNSHHVKR